MQQKLRRFTLVELLVVIAIIAILAALLLPALSRARQQVAITVCASRQHQIAMGYMMYADERDGYLPYGPRHAESGYTLVQGIPTMLRNDVFAALDDYGAARILVCPNGPRVEPVYVPSYRSYNLGMLSLTGHPLPAGATWTSPRNLRDDSTLAILVDSSIRSTTVWETTVLHRAFAKLPANTDPRLGGLSGHNVARLDGSVQWTYAAELGQHKLYYNLGNTNTWVPNANMIYGYF